MKTISEIRLDNLRLLIEEFGTQDNVAEKSGASPVYLSQIKNETPDMKTGRPRQMGDRMARKLELGCDKPIGWMDKTHEDAREIVTYPTTDSQPHPTHSVSAVVHMPTKQAGYDVWTLAAIEILQALDIGQRQAMVARMREFQQYLAPPRIGQAL